MSIYPTVPHLNRVAPEVEKKILAMALECPTVGAQRFANELRLQGVNVSPSGLRGAWQRHDLLTDNVRSLSHILGGGGLDLVKLELRHSQ